MLFPNDFFELIITISLSIGGFLTYVVATRNRGSFADTPDWSKVIRRIVELLYVFIALLFIAHTGWNYSILIRILIIAFPILGLVMALLLPKIINMIAKTNKCKDSKNNPQFKDNLAEHLVNAIILALFFLSTMLVGFISLTRAFNEISATQYTIVILDFLLSANFALLSYQLYYLVFVNNIPNEEIIQIVRICKELNQ